LGITQLQRIVALAEAGRKLFELVLALEVYNVELAVAFLLLHELAELDGTRIVELLDVEELRNPLIVALHNLELLLNKLGVALQLQLLLRSNRPYRFLLNF